MRDYTMVIHGTGHHSKDHHPVEPTLTSDQLLEKFVKELKDSGHVVEVATITHGGREKITAE